MLERRIEIDPTAQTVTVDGGITYAELCPLLDAAGWALFNLAVGAGLHSGGRGDDRDPWLGRHATGTSRPRSRRSRSSRRRATSLRSGAASRTSMGRWSASGALGVVTAMTLDLVPRFEMRQDVFHRLPFETVVEQLRRADGQRLQRQPVHPLERRCRRPSLAQGARRPPLPVAEFFGGTCRAGRLQPGGGARSPYGTTAQMGVPGPWYDRLPHARIGALPADGYEYQSEYFVARADAPAAMRALKAIEAALHPVARRLGNPHHRRRRALAQHELPGRQRRLPLLDGARLGRGRQRHLRRSRARSRRSRRARTGASCS